MLDAEVFVCLVELAVVATEHDVDDFVWGDFDPHKGFFVDGDEWPAEAAVAWITHNGLRACVPIWRGVVLRSRCTRFQMTG